MLRIPVLPCVLMQIALFAYCTARSERGRGHLPSPGVGQHRGPGYPVEQGRLMQRKGSGGELVRGPAKARQKFDYDVTRNDSAALGKGRASDASLQWVARRLHRQYVSAFPFRHVVIDDLLPPGLVRGSMVEIQKKTDDTELWKTRKTPMGMKRGLGGSTDTSLLGSNTEHVTRLMQSSMFVRFLETLTGIRNLTIDAKRFGGGPFSIIGGGYLSLHTDFNKHMSGGRVVTPGWRRLNVLLYLNEDWKEEYGGSFELWQTDREYSFLDYCLKVVPQLNRMAIFSVTDISIHGHLDLVNHPHGEPRKSLSFYYYTPTIDDEPLITEVIHESIYMPGHARLRSTDRWRTMLPRAIIR